MTNPGFVRINLKASDLISWTTSISVGLAFLFIFVVGSIDCVHPQSQAANLGCGENLNPKGLEVLQKANALFHTGITADPKEGPKIGDAMPLFEEAIRLEPRLISPYLNLSVYYDAAEDNPEKALTLLKKGVSHCPQEPDLHFSAGVMYSHAKKYSEAIASYEKALQLNYKGPLETLYLNIGTNYARLGEYDQSIPYLKKSLEINPTKLDAYQNLSLVYLRKGDRLSARKTAEKLKELDPRGRYGEWAAKILKDM